MEKQNIRQLVEQYLSGDFSEFERQQLIIILRENEELLTEVLNEMQEANSEIAEATDKEQMAETLQNVLSADKLKSAPVVSLNIKATKKWWLAVASVIIILAGLGTWYFVNRPEIPQQVAIETKEISAPDANRAMITLADGSSVFLDELTDGQIAEQGKVKLIKLEDGRLAYQGGGDQEVGQIQYNTLTNPRGSRVIDLKLTDGTRVWLNAESSITYPVTFSSSDRKVELKGEGYFEVAHDARRPFFVEVNKMEIKVIGTHFNVNAYEDEGDIRATLLEGSVAVHAGGQSEILKPGQQAVLQTANSQFQIASNTDVEQVMAWKNGYFSFNGVDLATIMRQASRWYDVEILYNGKVNETFSGSLPRAEDLSQLLQILEATGKVQFEVEGKQVIIKSK